MFGGKLGLPELLLILAIVLVIFGGKKIPEIMRGFGEGMRSFKEGMHGPDKPEDKSADTKK